MRLNLHFFISDCDVIPENPTYTLTYDASNVLYNAVAAPSGQKHPRTIAILECATGWFLPYSITGSLTPVTSQSYSCDGGSFNAGSPVCRLGIVLFLLLVLVFKFNNQYGIDVWVTPLFKLKPNKKHQLNKKYGEK